jgi:hypothetical protein
LRGFITLGIRSLSLPENLSKILDFAKEIFRDIKERVGTRLITLDVAKIGEFQKLVQIYQTSL